MLIYVIDFKMIAYRKFIQPRHIVDQMLYLKVLESLRQRVRRVKPEIFPWKADPAILHQVKASSLTAPSVKEFLEQISISALENAAYSLDLAPRDFFLFFAMENHSKRQHFKATDGIQKVTIAVLNR
jgi:hypothetical protein